VASCFCLSLLSAGRGGSVFVSPFLV
jgi:hypothetical protein